MSVDMANALHFDVNDASHRLNVWTEDIPGMAHNWYYVMPNLLGTTEDGTQFNGVAVRLLVMALSSAGMAGSSGIALLFHVWMAWKGPLLDAGKKPRITFMAHSLL